MSQSGTMRILQAIHFELKFIKMDRKSARIKLSIVPARSIVRGVIFLADAETKG